MTRTLVFCTAYATSQADWTMRFRLWTNAILQGGIAHDHVLIVDDGSPVLPTWDDTRTIRSLEVPLGSQPVTLFSFARRLGRQARTVYPGWFRSFCFAAQFAEIHDFDKVVHIESDAYVISKRMSDYINAIDNAWCAPTILSHAMPESAIQIMAGNGLSSYIAFSKRPYSAIVGIEAENVIPFTHIENSYLGSRYGETLSIVPREADFVTQTNPSMLGSSSYYWWLEPACFPFAITDNVTTGDLEQAGALSVGPFVYGSLSQLSSCSQTLLPEMQVFTKRCLVYTNFLDLNVAFGSHHLTNLYIDRQRKFEAVTLERLPSSAKIAVPTSGDFMLFDGSFIVKEQINPHWHDADVRLALELAATENLISRPSILIARYGIRTWGHWMGELLPKLLVAEHRFPGRFDFIVPEAMRSDPVHATALQSLTYYGIPNDRLIFVTPGFRYRCQEVYGISPVWSDHSLHHQAAQLMRDTAPASNNPRMTLEKIALLRRRTETRFIENVQDVEDVLVSRGFSIVDIEDLTFNEQVDLFKNARYVVSILGSGLAGLVFAPLGVKVLTLAPSDWGDMFFFALMQEREASLADVRGVSSIRVLEGDASRGFRVAPSFIESGLDALG